MNILSDLNLQNLPEDEIKNLLASLSESFLRRITVRIYENLDESGRTEFESVAAKNDPAALDLFLRTRIPDLESIQKKELEDLVKEIRDFQAGSPEV